MKILNFIKNNFAITVFLFSFLVLFILYYDIIIHYYPNSDDISISVNSTGLYKNPEPLKWITNGFEDYFRTYPEWVPHSKEIMRPFVNVIIYSEGLLFGKNYFLYLILNIFIHSLGTSFVFIFSRKYLNLGLINSSIAAFIFLFTPAVSDNFVLFLNSFIFDAIIGLFIFLIYRLMSRNKVVPAFIISFLLLFMKETVMLIPLLIAYQYIQNNKTSIAIKDKRNKYIFYTIGAGIILLWLLIKLLLGYQPTAGLFPFDMTMIKLNLSYIIRGLVIWPEGFNFDEIFSNLNMFIYAIIILFNLTIIITLIKQYKSGKLKYPVLWVLTLLVLPVFLGLNSRFGYSVHMFLVPLIIFIIANHKSKSIRLLFCILCFIIFSYGIITTWKNINPQSVNEYKQRMNSAKQLTDLLKKVDSTNVNKIYLINDICSYFNPIYLQEFSGIKKEIVKINSLSGFRYSKTEENSNASVRFSAGEKLVSISIINPSYISFYFEFVNPFKFEHKENEQFERNDNIKYLFPFEKVIGYSKSRGTKKYDLGNQLELSIKSNEPIALIYFNTSSTEYELKIIDCEKY